jgi:small nuclear ribonucleoprotein (snRNP)-like protein
MRNSKTLSTAVLSPCIGSSVEVELETDLVIRGILDDCDQDMNLVLGKCRCFYVEGLARGKSLPDAELIFVSGRNIRFIRLDDLNIDEAMKNAWLQRQRHLKRRHLIVDRPKSDHKRSKDAV